MCGGVLTWSWTVRGRGTARSRSSVEAKAWGKGEAHEVSSMRSAGSAEGWSDSEV